MYRVVDAATRLAVVCLVVVLAACGGGGGGGGGGSSTGSPPTQQPVQPRVEAPIIDTSPAAIDILDGQSASFSVAARGEGMTYQWQRNGQDIPGATAASYAISNATPVDDGALFSVVVSNAGGRTVSVSARLGVALIAPAIVADPQSATVLAGASASFSVTASGSVPLTFQWRKNGNPIAGAKSASYVTPATTLGDSGALYDVVVANGQGSVVSAVVSLTVSAVPIAPSIVVDPQSARAVVGGAVAFAVTASGTQPFTYQWRRNGLDIPNANGATYTVAPVSSNDNSDRFSVRISNSLGQATSAEGVLSVSSQPGQIDLVAGMIGGEGNADGTGASAHFHGPQGIAADSAGNLYVADYYNYTIRKITPAGATTTFAGARGVSGNVDATGTDARFMAPSAVAVDAADNVYVVDNGKAIRMITPQGVVTTIAGAVNSAGFLDATGTAARFSGVGGMAFDSLGNLFIADSDNHVIRKMTPAGVVTTFAGSGQMGYADGTGIAATFQYPTGIAIDSADTMYVTEPVYNTVRQITPADVVTTLAGDATVQGGTTDGTGSAARFRSPIGIAVDGFGNVFVADSSTSNIRKIAAGAVVTTLAGHDQWGSADGTGAAAEFNNPWGVTVDASNTLYVTDFYNNTIRAITQSGVVTTFAGQVARSGFVDGSSSVARFNWLAGITTDAANNIYVADSTNCAVRKIDSTNAVTTLVGTPVWQCNVGMGSSPFRGPEGIAIDATGNLYVADYFSSSIYKVTSGGVTTQLAGGGFGGGFGTSDGIGTAARIPGPRGVSVNAAGTILYVTDSYNHTIRAIDLNTLMVTTLAGTAYAPGTSDGSGGVARFNGPLSVEVGPDGNLYVADTDNHAIRKVTPAGLVTTFAGTPGTSGAVDGAGSAAQFYYPTDLSFDAAGNMYVVDAGNLLIRKVASNGVVSRVAGMPELIGQTLGALPASLNPVRGIRVQQLSGSSVKLLVTTQYGVIAITLP